MKLLLRKEESLIQSGLNIGFPRDAPFVCNRVLEVEFHPPLSDRTDMEI